MQQPAHPAATRFPPRPPGNRICIRPYLRRGFIPGASGGATNLFGWVATGLVEEARALAAPTLLPVFSPVQTEREGQRTQAAELAAIFSRAALTGQPDFPSRRAQASAQPPP